MSFLGTEPGGITGVGVYTLEQAATLVRLRVSTVDAIVGLKPSGETPPQSYPIAVAEIDLGFEEKIITFLGLMELWVSAEIRRAGVPWSTIRYAAYQAGKVLNSDHPLTRGNFRTDGRRVFLSLGSQAEKMPRTAVDLLSRQQVFEDVIERSLTPAIVVRDRDGRIRKWFPLGKRIDVVLDPERRFGEPIDPGSGVPTTSLAEAYHAEGGNLAAAARWFDTTKKAIKDAIAFEQWLHQS